MDHDVRSSVRTYQEKMLSVKAVRAMQVRRWIIMMCPSAVGFFCGVEIDPTLTVIERKAFAAMVNIDGSDGGFCGVLEGLIAGKPAPTGLWPSQIIVGAGLPAMRH
ncbi:hypothetical protein AEQ67_20215 [Pseudomonas sp. RIT-PI-q]|uniref:hypothetical protein n=1 Tax=Pseudomonas sp. RIT-PI-q TaxID=1690247 RepID=UPI0006CCB8CB|nr:hypothetical protein [Pseudomonas sp. RIT-PI-q]KPG95555.1 hypothetical protein AEQ67_20215 [Pseudomonas sp. RIT-PI-q]